jgi:hypothetical protein
LDNFVTGSSLNELLPGRDVTLPEWTVAITRYIPLSYDVDAFRSTLMGFPPGFPELAPIETELVIVTLFGLLMPLLGFWLYRQVENRARMRGSLSEY